MRSKVGLLLWLLLLVQVVLLVYLGWTFIKLEMRSQQNINDRVRLGLATVVGNDSNNYYEATGVYAFIDKVGKRQDRLFPDSSVVLDLVFVDKEGRGHKYKARIGGTGNGGEPVLVLPFEVNGLDRQFEGKVDEIKSFIKDGAYVRVGIMTKDKSDNLWAGAKQINGYSGYNERILEALKKGYDFPQLLPPDFILQIISMRLIDPEFNYK